MTRIGSGCKTGVMSEQEVARFKAEMYDGEPILRKAERYPVSAAALYQIRNKLTWRNIEPSKENKHEN